MHHDLHEQIGKFDRATLRAAIPVVALSLLLLAILTATLSALQQFVDVGTVTIFYLIAVLFAAIRGGVIPAVICAVVAVGASAFFSIHRYTISVFTIRSTSSISCCLSSLRS